MNSRIVPALAGVCGLLASQHLAAVEKLPVETFAQASIISRARLSPDGKSIAFIRESDDNEALILLDVASKKMVRIDPPKTQSGLVKEVPHFRWVSDDRVAFMTTVWDGFYYTGMTAVNSDGRSWTPFAGSDGDPTGTKPLWANTIIHSFNDKDRNVLMLDMRSGDGTDTIFPDVVKVSTVTKHVQRVVKNPGNVVAWSADFNGVVRLGITRDELDYGAIYRANEAEEWRTLPVFARERGVIAPLGFDRDGRRILVAANSETRRRAIFYFDPEKGELGDLIAGHDEYDIILQQSAVSVDGASLASTLTSELVDTIVGVRYVTDGPKVQWFDPGLAALQQAVDRALPDTVNLIVSRTRDERRFLILSYSDRDPGKYLILDVASGKPELTLLSECMINFPVASMARMFPIKYDARDGKTIHGYLTIPPGRKQKGLPLVVMPHGGPTVRDVWGFDPTVQFLANRGYAVLQMNYRGSPGYGVDFFEGGMREIGRAIQTDIDDATKWAIEKGIADPERVAIVGGSYGGYSALFAAGRSPELYRCAISIAGVTDWAEIFRDRREEEYRFAYLHWRQWIGDPSSENDLLASISPVNFADKITIPVLIVQGRDDRTVPPKQARRMVDALKKAGREPETLYFNGEGHGFRRLKSRVSLYKEMEAFLAKHVPPDAGG